MNWLNFFRNSTLEPRGANAQPTDIQVQQSEAQFSVQPISRMYIFPGLVISSPLNTNPECIPCLDCNSCHFDPTNSMRTMSRNTNDHPIEVSKVSSNCSSSSDLKNSSNNPPWSCQRRPKTLLPINFEPSDADVICGKGKNVFLHEGNCRFRSILEQHLDAYDQADTERRGPWSSTRLSDLVRKDCVNGGGLWRQDRNGGVVGDGLCQCERKIGHSISRYLDALRTVQERQNVKG
jgi:hypothetical protein